MTGDGNNLFNPKAEATRADTAKAIYEVMMIKRDYQSSLGRMAPVTQYNPPYDEVPLDDRFAESKPTPFDANIWPKRELIVEDFEDADFGDLTQNGFSNANISFDYENGYNSKGCLKVTGDPNGDVYPTFRWTAPPGELKAGDFLVFSTRIKTENVSGDGSFCGKVAVYDDNGKWLAESWGNDQQANLDEWTELQWIQLVTEELNDLTPPEFYTTGMGAFVRKLSGTFYFDDFKLSVVNFDPMHVVFMEPVFKGIVKGEGGIGDIVLRAYINDGNGFYDLDKFKLTAQITDEDHKVYLKSESETVTGAMDIYFSSDTLPMGGDFFLETILTDKETGEIVQKNEQTLHKRESDFETKFDVDKYGRITRYGKPYFPISVINSSTYDDAINDFISSGCIDTYFHHGVGWYYNWGDREDWRKEVSKLEEHDMDIVLAFGTLMMDTTLNELKSKIKTQEDLRGVFSRIVNNFKDFPSLFSYYIFDEENAMRYGEEFSWARKIIESIDLDHPTTCAIDSTLPYRPGAYAQTSDFLGYDPYPVTGKPDQDISLVYDRIAEAKMLNPNRPVYAILQGFWYNTRGDLRSPDKEEFRNMAFQAITAGACMLDMYSYRWLKTTPSPAGFEEDWKNYTEVFSEVQYLEPIIMSALPTPYYEVQGGGEWFNTMTRHYDGKSYLFAVNNENESKVARVYLDGVKEIKGMYSKKTYKADNDGWFKINMEGYEVEVFEYEQQEFKSSHAELMRFGLADTITINSEGEAEFVLSEDIQKINYSADVSDNAKIYINGIERECVGELELTGISEIAVKVVSEDGRFTTERTYKIQRT